MNERLLPAELFEMAEKVVSANAAAGRRVAVAESCTGGLVASALTEIAGSSAVLDRGFVVYSNESKIELLGVRSDILDTFGAVSMAAAWAMAVGALQHSNADVAVAITGIAGPGGGSDQKPVGTVFFSRALRGVDPRDCNAELKQLPETSSRAEVRLQAALVALELLLP